jgi:sulfide:quinone oxidoreductase
MAQLLPLAPGLSVAGRLDRADIDALAAAGVRTIINNRPDGEDAGQLPAAEARCIAGAHGIAYHHIPITAATLSRR